MTMTLLAQIMEVVIIPLLGILTAYVVKIVNAKLEEVSASRKNELEKKYTEFQSLAADTPETIKQRRIQEIQEFEQKIQQFRATAQQELQRQQEQLMAPIQQKIQSAIQAVGTENGFTFIFPDAIPSFVGADVQDVTPLVKTKLGIQ